MNRSESINELAAAMAKAQGSIENAAKDAANPFFRSKYADLASCWDACRKSLSENGLAVIQLPRTEGATVTITTILTHSSGQFISEDLTMTSKRQLKDGGGWEIVDNPQGLGSTITYARRYSLCAMVGVAPEDDDGNAGSGRGSQQAANEVAARKIAESQPKATADEDIPEELRSIFTLIRKDRKNIPEAYKTLMHQFEQYDGGLDYYDRLVEAFNVKYPKGASTAINEGLMLDMWDMLVDFRNKKITEDDVPF